MVLQTLYAHTLFFIKHLTVFVCLFSFQVKIQNPYLTVGPSDLTYVMP